jgi:hypothetical protein
MGDYIDDNNFKQKYQHFIDTLSKQADDYVARKYGVYPPNEDKDSKEKPICTTNEFKDVCKELGLEED